MVKFKEKLRVKNHLIVARYVILKNDKKNQFNNDQKAKRDETISYLQTYIKEGNFPKNTDFKGKKPYIQDSDGTLCAMAYLIQNSGNSQLVDELDNEGRNYYIKEFQSQKLGQWLNQNSITVEEAVRIQPTYGGFNEYVYANHAYKFVILALQILFLTISILLYKFRFKSIKLIENISNLSISENRQKGSPIAVIGIFISALIFTFPIVNYRAITLFGSLYARLLFFDSELNSIYSVILLASLLMWYFIYRSFDKIFHPLVPYTIFLCLLIYYPIFIWYTTLDNTLFVIQNGWTDSRIDVVQPKLGIGFFFYLLILIILFYQTMNTISIYEEHFEERKSKKKENLSRTAE